MQHTKSIAGVVVGAGVVYFLLMPMLFWPRTQHWKTDVFVDYITGLHRRGYARGQMPVPLRVSLSCSWNRTRRGRSLYSVYRPLEVLRVLPKRSSEQRHHTFSIPNFGILESHVDKLCSRHYNAVLRDCA